MKPINYFFAGAIKRMAGLVILLFVIVAGSLNKANATDCPGATMVPAAPTFPYVINLSCGTTDDINDLNSTPCGSAYYVGGFEALYVWTPTDNYVNVSFAYTGQTWTGIFLFDGCPTSGGVCIGNYTSSGSSKTLAYEGTNMTSGTTISLIAGHTYYIMVDTWPTPDSPCPGTLTINGTVNPPCTGTPAPGNTISTANPVCSGVSFTLSLQNATPGSGVTYQWQSSPDGITWTNIGTGASTLLTSQTVPTYYQCLVTCAGNTGTSTPINVTMSTLCYCACASTSLSWEFIGGVVATGGINNTGTPHSNYTDYPGQISVMAAGTAMTVVVSSGGTWYGTDSCYIFVDLNQDSDFLDAGERIGSAGGATSPYTINFTIPISATVGLTGMRVKFGDTDGTIAMNADPCQNDYTWGETEDYRINILAPPTCYPPTNPSVTNILSNTATVSWGAPAGGTPVAYFWMIVPQGAGTGGTIIDSDTTFVPITTDIANGLSPATSYDFYVLTYCGGVDLSSWAGPITFTTQCLPFTIPYFENFDGVTEPDVPMCLTVTNDNADAYTWVTESSFPYSGTNSMYIEYNSAIAMNDWFFTPGLNLTGGVTYVVDFYYANDGTTTWPEKLEVMWGTAPVAASMTGGSIFNNDSIVDDYQLGTGTFTPATSGVYFVGFHGYSDADMDILMVDDVSIYVVPTCPQPNTLVTSNITQATADLDWTETGTATSWQVCWGEAGFIPGDVNEISRVLTGTKPYQITGLLSNHEYSAYVRSVCAVGDTSTWSGIHTFYTSCGYFTVPYTETFETPSINCISVADIDGGGSFWNLSTSQNHTPAGAYSAVHVYSTAGMQDGYLYTPEIITPAMGSMKLSFWSYNSYPTDYDKNSVLISTDGGTTFTEIWTTAAVTSAWQKDSVDISTYLNDTIIVAFRYEGDNAHNWYVDDILIDQPPMADLAVYQTNVTNCDTLGWFTPPLTVTNDGNVTLNTGTVFQGSYQIDGGGWITESFTLTSDLLPGNNTVFMFATPYQFNLLTTYNCGFAVALPGDVDLLNDTAYFTLTQNPYPVVDLGTDTTICVYNAVLFDAGNPGASYLWWDGQTFQTAIYDTSDQPGVTNAIYWVDVTINGCTSRDSIVVTWDLCTGIDETTDATIRVLPNPTNGAFVLDFGGLTGNTRIEIMDLLGQVVLAENIVLTGVERLTYDLNGYAKGIYNLRVINGDVMHSIKVVKQ